MHRFGSASPGQVIAGVRLPMSYAKLGVQLGGILNKKRKI